MARRFVVSKAAALLLLQASLAWGQSAPNTVELAIHTCNEDELPSSALYRALTLELVSDGAVRILPPHTQLPSDTSVEISVVCEESSRVTVLVSVSRGELKTSRTLILNDTPTADRPRAIALGAAEFLRAEWPRLSNSSRATQDDATSPPTAVLPPLESEAAPRPSAAPPAYKPPLRDPLQPLPKVIEHDASTTPKTSPLLGAHAVRVNGAGRMRWFPKYESLAYGGSAGLRIGRFESRAEIFAAHESTASFRARLGTAALTAMGSVLTWNARRFRLDAAPGAGLGLTWASGDATDSELTSNDQVAVYGDFRLEIRADYEFRDWAIVSALELGWAAGVAQQSARETIGGLAGPFAGVLIGAQF